VGWAPYVRCSAPGSVNLQVKQLLLVGACATWCAGQESSYRIGLFLCSSCSQSSHCSSPKSMCRPPRSGPDRGRLHLRLQIRLCLLLGKFLSSLSRRVRGSGVAFSIDERLWKFGLITLLSLSLFGRAS
jgi:hypothetical protein